MDQARRAENKLGLAEHLADASARLGVSALRPTKFGSLQGRRGRHAATSAALEELEGQ